MWVCLRSTQGKGMFQGGMIGYIYQKHVPQAHLGCDFDFPTV